MTREELNQHKQQEIIDEQNREKRKKITIFIFKLAFVLVASFLLFFLYTSYISSKVLSVKEERIIDKKLPDSFNGLKVIHFSDLHYGTNVFSSEVENVVNEINKRAPDIVVFTGDLVDASYDLKMNEQEALIKSLEKIDAKLGKYAIAGEEDSDTFDTVMKQSNFEVLDNSYEYIYNDDDTPILLIGLSSMLSGDSDIDEAFSYFADPTHNSKIFSITLMHEPDIADEILAKYNTDLLLAGHSHNGNIRLPYFGALYKVNGAKKYDQAFYSLKEADLYVSSGIGTNGPGFRLFCRPSFNFFRISNM